MGCIRTYIHDLEFTAVLMSLHIIFFANTMLCTVFAYRNEIICNKKVELTSVKLTNC